MRVIFSRRLAPLLSRTTIGLATGAVASGFAFAKFSTAKMEEVTLVPGLVAPKFSELAASPKLESAIVTRAEATDAMIAVPGSRQPIMYLAPKASGESSATSVDDLPQIVKQHAVFTVSAWVGEADESANKTQNRALLNDLRDMDIRPAAVWRSFGYNVENSWREETYTVAFPSDMVDVGRDAVITLARKYNQPTIHEYTYIPSSTGKNERLVKKVVDIGSRSTLVEKDMRRVQEVPATPLAMGGYTSVLGDRI